MIWLAYIAGIGTGFAIVAVALFLLVLHGMAYREVGHD